MRISMLAQPLAGAIFVSLLSAAPISAGVSLSSGRLVERPTQASSHVIENVSTTCNVSIYSGCIAVRASVPVTVFLGECLTCLGFNATVYTTKNGVPTHKLTDVISVKFEQEGEAVWDAVIVASRCRDSNGVPRFALDYSSYGPPPSGLSGSIGISCLRSH
jgi:hypothetical protein